MRTRSIALVALLGFCTVPALADESKTPIGAKVENFTLNDYHGQPYSLDQAGDDKIVVLSFLGPE